jgi:hypothetical protein
VVFLPGAVIGAHIFGCEFFLSINAPWLSRIVCGQAQFGIFYKVDMKRRRKWIADPTAAFDLIAGALALGFIAGNDDGWAVPTLRVHASRTRTRCPTRMALIKDHLDEKNVQTPVVGDARPTRL